MDDTLGPGAFARTGKDSGLAGKPGLPTGDSGTFSLVRVTQLVLRSSHCPKRIFLVPLQPVCSPSPVTQLCTYQQAGFTRRHRGDYHTWKPA